MYPWSQWIINIFFYLWMRMVRNTADVRARDNILVKSVLVSVLNLSLLKQESVSAVGGSIVFSCNRILLLTFNCGKVKLLDFLLCRHCGTDIASAASIVNLKSPAATTRVNQTVFGLENVLVQTIDNPLKIQFKVITTLETYCLARGKWSTDHSWFPGYAWKACTCSRCGHHLGWAFEPLATANPEKERPSAKGFFAVILDNVISELFSNSLLITPQTTTIR